MALISKRIPVLLRNPALPSNASSGPVIPLAASMAQKTAFLEALANAHPFQWEI